jgi:hypothetical protein
MENMKNKPRISKWIGGGYLLLFLLIVVIYVAIGLWSGVFNYLVAGIIYNIAMLCAIVLIGVTVYCLYNTSYVVKDDSLHSGSPFATMNISLQDIETIEQTRIPFYFKGWGASLYSGRFYIPAVGWARVIITNLTDGVLITGKDGRHYLITPSDPAEFVKQIHPTEAPHVSHVPHAPKRKRHTTPTSVEE